MAYTLSYSDAVKGFPSFYSFFPERMVGANNYFYSFHHGDLYRHNVNPVRNQFYDVTAPSRVVTPINDNPLDNKLFKTLALQGDHRWDATVTTDTQGASIGFIDASYFEKKEEVFFSYIRSFNNQPVIPTDYPLRSLNGIGSAVNVIAGVDAATIFFQTNPKLDIGSIISIGDYVYVLELGDITPKLVGILTSRTPNYDENFITINTDISGAQPINTTTPFVMFAKNTLAESHGALGHYAVVDLQNEDTEKVELFALQADVMKSFP